MLNDVIIGAAFGSFLCENQHILAQLLHYSLEVRINHVTIVLSDINDAADLSRGRSETSAPMVEQLASGSQAQYGIKPVLLPHPRWCCFHMGMYVLTPVQPHPQLMFVDTGVLGHAAPYFPSLIWIIGATGYCGMTAAALLLSDALSLLTAHLYLCYFISATVYSNQLSLASSLWNLFRGKPLSNTRVPS